jgi:hypothetical protein
MPAISDDHRLLQAPRSTITPRIHLKSADVTALRPRRRRTIRAALWSPFGNLIVLFSFFRHVVLSVLLRTLIARLCDFLDSDWAIVIHSGERDCRFLNTNGIGICGDCVERGVIRLSNSLAHDQKLDIHHAQVRKSSEASHFGPAWLAYGFGICASPCRTGIQISDGLIEFRLCMELGDIEFHRNENMSWIKLIPICETDAQDTDENKLSPVKPAHRHMSYQMI